MSKDRIQIDGVWYIKEETKSVDFNSVEYKGRVYESELYCFNVTKSKKDDGTYYDDVGIEFTDKREKPYKEHHFYNVEWLLGVLYGSEESLEHAKEIMCEQGIAELKVVVDDLLLIEWIKR